ncbi:hypothetical protein SNOG_05600 [Parastagonospora nodorum SN15]|uniref:Uncharacterized protein n=1 Tax=Phaeosphaeria nodorum (strain SN15 / ATCC MYA-4574 / FGSC 10173) TaxID=321614 RepID=Q0URL4_PHANO|nr:hypothetical protein SNOG_05600 [Parastagonospora nodorum SN15]EAT86664.1 hypothetical protein SNOG_05600 [Parastagonospora nodorum SN15]
MAFISPIISDSGAIWKTFKIEVHVNTEQGDSHIDVTTSPRPMRGMQYFKIDGIPRRSGVISGCLAIFMSF